MRASLLLLLLLLGVPLRAQTTCLPKVGPPLDSIYKLANVTTSSFSASRKTAIKKWVAAGKTAGTICRDTTVTVYNTVVKTVIVHDTVGAPPPRPVVTGPLATYNFACSTTACVLDGRASTGNKRTFRWHADDPERPIKIDSVITRNCTAFTRSIWVDTLTVTDSAGNFSTTTKNLACLPSPTPTPTPTPPPPTTNGAVTRAIAPTLINFATPVPTRVVKLTASSNVQAAIDSAKRGDALEFPAGAVFTGSYVLRAKPGTGWITIRTSGTQSARGIRVSPADAPQMPKFVSPNVGPVFATELGASGWWLDGVEITTTSDPYTGYGLLLLGDGGTAQTTMALVATDLAVVRSYIHGSPTTGSQRCIGLNSANTIIEDNYVYDCTGKGFDTQAIGGWNGPGPYRIVNNMLAGSGENVMLGGADPRIVGLVPSDVEIRGNYLYTPQAWRGIWTKKNLLELKNARRVIVEGNVLDGSWADAQTGVGIVLKSTNQSGGQFGGTGGCTWCRVTDVLIRHNLIRNVAAPFTFSAKDPGVVDSLGRRWTAEENWVELTTAEDGRMIQIYNNVADLTLSRNVFDFTPGTTKDFIAFEPKIAVTNFEFIGNIGVLGTYGIFSSVCGIGDITFGCAAVGALHTGGNAFVGPSVAGYASQIFQPSLAAALASGYGVARSVIDAATAGVVHP